MLQAPSHFSRVCGHGHIKKFWLMQTQKESQAYDSKSNLLFASQTSRPANRASLKGGDVTPRSSTSPLSHSSAFGDAAGTPPKHATLTCAQSLSPSPRFRKASSIPSPHYRRASSTSSSLGSSGVESEKEMLNGRFDSFGSYAIAIGEDVHMPVALPCSQPVNATDEQASRDSDAPHTDIDCSKPSPVRTDYSIKQRTFSFTENSADSHSSQVSGGIQRLGGHRSLEPCSNQAAKIEDRSSPAQASRDFKSFSCPSRITTPSSVRDTVEKGNDDVLLVSRTQEINHDRSNVGYMQHPVLKACSLCGTTKTPMWRSGPQGPKSLCNACGIRFKKYRCFPGQESSEPLPSPSLGSASPRSLPRPLKRKQNSSIPAFDPVRSQKICLNTAVPDAATHQQQKKSRLHQLVVERGHSGLKDLSQDRCSPWLTRVGPPSLKKIYGCSPFQSKFNKLMPMDDHLGVNGVFAKDEEEAAVLLMHLSCGLVY